MECEERSHSHHRINLSLLTQSDIQEHPKTKSNLQISLKFFFGLRRKDALLTLCVFATLRFA